MSAHIVTVVATDEGRETYRNTVRGRNHKKDEVRKAMETIKGYGEILTTESNAKYWAVYAYHGGDQFAKLTGSREK